MKEPSNNKLLHILYSGQGGLGTYFMNFVNSDHKQHFEHFAFFYGIEPLNQELEEFCKKNAIAYQYQQRQSKIDFKAIGKVLDFQKKHEIQYLLLHTYSLSLLTLLGIVNKWKLIAIEHTPQQVKTQIEHLFSLINHLFACKIIYFYKGHFEQTKKKFPFLSFGKNSHIIPKNVDPLVYKPRTTKSKNDTFTLGTTARIIHGKRHDLIINALHIIKQKGITVKLKVAGSGPLEAKIKQLVKKLNLESQVDFTGVLSREDIVSFYQSLDGYIHASDGETICYSIMEAQACGLPILASDVEGINNNLSVLEGGVLFNNESEDISNKISLLVEDSKLRDELSDRAQNEAKKKYNDYNNAEMFYTLIKK